MATNTMMSARDVAALFGVSVETVNRHARAGLLPVAAKAPGTRGARMFDADAVRAMVAGDAS